MDAMRTANATAAQLSATWCRSSQEADEPPLLGWYLYLGTEAATCLVHGPTAVSKKNARVGNSPDPKFEIRQVDAGWLVRS